MQKQMQNLKMMIFNDYAYFAKGGYQFKQMQTKPKIMVGRFYASKDFTRPFGSIDGSYNG